MARLIYSAIASLDGYTNDADGRFDWLAPDEEVHAFVNDCERPVGTYLYGRRMYDVLVAWETMDVSGESPAMQDYQRIWRGADKIVYTRTLAEPRSERTRIEREFDPEAVRALKASADRDISVGGPELAGQAIRAGLVDAVSLFLSPVTIGGGNAALPEGVQLSLELIAERRFGNGVVYVSYATSGSGSS